MEIMKNIKLETRDLYYKYYKYTYTYYEYKYSTLTHNVEPPA